MKNDTIKVELIHTEERVPDIAELVYRVEGAYYSSKQDVEATWKWRFGSPSIINACSVIALSNAGDLIGHRGILRPVYKIGNTLRPFGMQIDTVVDSRYRRQGIYTAMRYKTSELNLENNIWWISRQKINRFAQRSQSKGSTFRLPIYARIYNLSNILNASLDRKIHEYVIEKIPFVRQKRMFMKVVTKPIEWILNRKLPETFSGTDSLEAFRTFDDSFTNVLARFEEKYQLVANRSIEYLNWRFSEKSGRTYYGWLSRDKRTGNVIGYIVVRLFEMYGLKVLAVCDLISEDNQPEIQKILLNQLEQFANEISSDISICAGIPGSTNHPSLRAMGFIKTPAAYTVRFHSTDKTTGRIFETLQPSQCHVTLFDHDYY